MTFSHILGFSVISLLSERLREKMIQRGDHLLGQVSFNRSRTGKLDFSQITFSKSSLSSDEPIENEIWRRDPLLRQVGDSWTGRVCPAIRYLDQVLNTAGQSDI